MDIFTEKKDRGYIALGFNGDISYIWSEFKQCIFKITPKDFTQNALINILGNEFIYNNYRDMDLKAKDSINYKALINDIINDCQKEGIYNIENNKGAGVWEISGDLIVNTKNIFGNNKEYEGERIYKKNVFVFSKDLEINKNTLEATEEERHTVFKLLNTFNWKRGDNDTKLFYGWILHAYINGALKWRSHSYVSGEGGAGKSTLQKMVSYLLNKNAILVDGASSEAGIRQKIGNDSGAVLIDESEASETKMLSILNMFRSASSSAQILRGSADGTAKDYTLRFCGLLTGIIPLNFNQADNGRYLKLELQTFDRNNKRDERIADEEYLIDLGKRLQMFMINNYKKLLTIKKIVDKKMLLNNSDRYTETFGILIACSYLALHNNEDEEQIKTYVESFDFEEEQNRSKSKDHDECFETLLNREIIRIDTNQRITVLQQIFYTYYCLVIENSQSCFVGSNNTLGKYGIRVLDNKEKLEILISPTNLSLRSLLKGTRFENGDLSSVLKRVEGAKLIKEQKLIGGIQKRGCILSELSDDKFGFSNYKQLRQIQD